MTCRPVPKLLAYSSMTIWKSLLLIYRRIDVRFTCGSFRERHFVHALSDEEINDAVSSFRAFPALVNELSQGEAKVTYEVVFIEEPLCFLTPDGEETHWVSPDDVRHEMDIHGRAGKYDSIFVFWPQTNLATGEGISTRGWGFGLGPGDWTNGATYAVVANAPTWAWNIPLVGEVWLHEWLHGVCGMLAEAGFDMPEYDADGGGSHGYVQSETTGWTSYYRDLMTGQVLESGTRKGITATAWRSRKPLACPGGSG
jgi:hypothetical protein